MRTPISWEEYWMKQVELISLRSRDPSMQVGSIAVDNENRLCSTGYNGFPRGIENTEDRWTRANKYKYVVHAEINLIANAVRTGARLEGCTIYLSIPPCTECAKALIQSGFKKVVYQKPPNPDSPLDCKHSFDLFKEAGVEIIQLSS